MERLDKGLVNRNGYIHIRKTIKGRRFEHSLKIPYEPRYFSLANDELSRLENAVRSGKAGARQPVTLEQACIRYVDECQKKSIARDVRALDRFVGMWGGLPLDQIDYSRVYDWLRKQSHSAGYLNRELAPLRTILKKAATIWRDEYGNRWMDHIEPLPSAQGPAKTGYPLSREEQKRLLEKMSSGEQGAVLFLIHTGMRIGEATSLEWDWLKEKDGVSYFALPATKNGHPRPVVLSTIAKSVLSAWRGRERPFPVRGYRWVRLAWDAAALPSQAQGQKISRGPHNFRHTCAQRMRDAGVREETRKDVLGHFNGDISQVYATPTLREMLEAVEAPYRAKMALGAVK
jgi:integrase